MTLLLLSSTFGSFADVYKEVRADGVADYSSRPHTKAVLVVSSNDARNIPANGTTSSQLAEQLKQRLVKLEDAKAKRAAVEQAYASFMSARDRLIAAQEEFAADWQIPEMVNRGKYRNYQRYVDKMRIRESNVELARSEYQRSLSEMNAILRDQKVPEVEDQVPKSKLYDEASADWRRMSGGM